jgi:hypothetical protein
MTNMTEDSMAFGESGANVDDTLTLVCGFVGVARSDHAFPMSMDRVNRVRLPSRFAPEDIERIRIDFELLAGLFRDHPDEMASLLESYVRKDATASRSVAASLGISEDTFTAQGGGIFWGLVAAIVVCDVVTRCIDSFFE